MRLLIFIMICLAGAAIRFAPASANDTLRDSCDPDFFDVMKARATLESKREVEMAQTIIRKPDSLLEYSCFAADITRMGDPAIARFLFSNNEVRTGGSRIFNDPTLVYAPNDLYQNIIFSEFGPEPGVAGVNSEGIQQESFPPDPSDNPHRYPGIDHFARNVSGDDPDGDGILNSNMIFDSLNDYTGINFNHTFLGGAADFDGTGTTTCDFMNRIWHEMKCTDFAMSYQDPDTIANPDDIEENWFPTFKELNPYDYRQLPQACNDPDRATVWDTYIAAAYPGPNMPGGVQVNEKVKYIIQGGVRSKVCCRATDYIDYTVYPPIAQQTDIDFCKVAPPVLTGLKTTVSGTEYDEGFCIRPGMTFFPDMPRDSRGRDTRCRFLPPPAPFSYSGTLPQCP